MKFQTVLRNIVLSAPEHFSRRTQTRFADIRNNLATTVNHIYVHIRNLVKRWNPYTLGSKSRSLRVRNITHFANSLLHKPTMSQKLSLLKKRFIKNVRANRTRDGVNTASPINIVFAHHIISFSIGFGHQRTGSNACPLS